MIIRREIKHSNSWVFSSEDYFAGELITHAQSCIWLVGYSDLSKSLLKGADVHAEFASTILGIKPEDFKKSNKKHKDTRQAAKPFNFGKPGGMGDPKLVLTQRKQGEDTECPNGTAMIKNDAGQLVPGYKGLRFCILMGLSDRCGEYPDGRPNKVTQWGKREDRFAPTCRICLEAAQQLSQIWKKQWSENEPYFQYINECTKRGMVIRPEALERWPWLREWYRPWQQLDVAQVMQHVSGRLRKAGKGAESPFCTLANGFFQALLADIAKAAHRQVVRECYDGTIRVPLMLYENSKPSRYAGMVSPLYGSRVPVFQHDEVICEHPRAVAHDASHRVAEVMEDSMRWFAPDLAAAAKVEPTLMDRWIKAATPMWERGGKKRADENDRLIPFTVEMLAA